MLSHEQVKAALQNYNGDPLQLLEFCEGHYRCPKGGPLVGYAGTYEPGKHFVGREYVNFARAERYPAVLDALALELTSKCLGSVDLTHGIFCGAPLGGMSFAQMLALINEGSYLFMEKRPIASAEPDQRSTSELVFGRHAVEPRQELYLVEDAVNNCSTTGAAIKLIRSYGAEVKAILCFLNRSPKYETEFEGTPIFSLVRQIIPEYRQDDPCVAADIQAGNIIWRPKDHWARLQAAMGQAA